MKCVLFSTLFATAAAFSSVSAPAAAAQLSSLKSFEGEIGSQPPIGFWDPLGLLDDADQERFDRLRYVEVKHGRIAMLAIVGQLTTRAGIHLGGDIDYSGTSFSSIGDGFSAFNDIPQAGLLQLIAFVGFLEVAVMKNIEGE